MNAQITALVIAACAAACGSYPDKVVVDSTMPDECKERMIDAVDWWRGHGADLHISERRGPLRADDRRIEFGVTEVVYTPAADFCSRLWGLTNYRVLRGRIRLCKCDSDYLMRHELGHAMKLDHVGDPENVMYKWDTTGETVEPWQEDAIRQ